MIAISRIMRTSLNRERRSEYRLPDKAEDEEEEEVVGEEEEEAVAEKDKGNCVSEVVCSFNGNGEESPGNCKFEEFDVRLEVRDV